MSERPMDESALDLAFERLLLRSARDDGPTEAQRRAAWGRFVTATGVAALAAGIDLNRGAVAGAVRRAAATGFVAGVLGGGALTVFWLGVQPTETPVSELPPSRSSSEAPAPPAASPALVLEAPPSAPPSASARSHPKRAAPLPAQSTLAAEVAALDAARSAFVAGRYPEVLQRIDAYRREFPSGQLAPDAEALSIEALAAAGDRAEAARRAERFLARYRKNAHTARITAIAGD